MRHYRWFSQAVLTVLVLLFVCVGGGTARVAAEELTLPDISSGKVVLSWDELKRLLEELEQSRLQRTQDEPDVQPPVDFSILEARFDGTIEEDTARFEAHFSVQVLKEDWVMIPLLTKEAAIETMTSVDPGAQFAADEQGYHLLYKGPGLVTFQTRFRVPLEVNNTLSTLVFQPPQAVTSSCRLVFPGQDIQVVSARPQPRLRSSDDGSVAQVYLGASETMTLSWRVAKHTGVKRRSVAQVSSLLSLTRSSGTVSSVVMLKHLTSLDPVEILLPREADIMDVTSSAVSQWTVDTLDHAQKVTLTAEQDREDEVEVLLAFRLPLPPLPSVLPLPAVTVAGVDSLEGYMGVEVLENLEVTAGDVSAGSQIPVKSLPKAIWSNAVNPLLYGYEFHDAGFSATLNVKPYQEIQTIVANVDAVDCVTHRTLEGKSMTSVRYAIRNHDRQFLAVRLPDKSRVWQVFLDGQPVKPARKDSGELLIPLKKTTGQDDHAQSVVVELGFIRDVGKLSLKGELINELPSIDLPVSYLRWTVYLPEDYEYTNFEGPLKHVEQFSMSQASTAAVPSQIDVPTQGKRFLFEKYLIVDEIPYTQSRYGQYLGDDIFLSLQPRDMQILQKVTPGARY